MSRLPLILGAASIAAVLGVTLSLTYGRGQDLADCFGTAVAGADIGGPFTLVDPTGATVTDTDVITEPSLIYFGYGFCPDVCPIDNARNVAAVDLLQERGIEATPIFISIDPERDTPEFMGDYAANMHPDMIGLTGSPEQVREAADAYRVIYSRNGDDPDYYLMNHSAFTYLMMPETGYATFFRRDTTPEEVAEQTACAVNTI
ncbi:SCO family protein [Salipiger sp. IMCC34102]|uniref:SCO family protein n=1 Tax=Salipiger sp. IMCC34102 TaxID=2510647 RepID=UPI00101D8A4D|nr:SCO family protein [Salipiger sp. IMCC34102]RYH04238.1 SCO family protein [Salipiger sp. IMCC34102]